MNGNGWQRLAWAERADCDRWIQKNEGYIASPIIDVGVPSSIKINRSIFEKHACYKTLSLKNADLNLDLTLKLPPNLVGSASTVVCTWVLEHCAAPQKMVENISRLLKPHGTAFFAVPFQWKIHTKDDYWRFTPEGMKLLCRKAGLAVLDFAWSRTHRNFFVLARKERV